MKSNKEIWNEVLDQLVPFTELKPYTGLGDSSVERKIKNFTFPQPVRTSSGKRSFRLKELKEWQKDPPSYSSKSE
jgi:predicted DNA-binding transcriptional regulator AlpA